MNKRNNTLILIVATLLLVACGRAPHEYGGFAVVECELDEDCLEGEVCTSQSAPNSAGNSRLCELSCEVDEDCPEGLSCLDRPFIPEPYCG